MEACSIESDLQGSSGYCGTFFLACNSAVSAMDACNVMRDDAVENEFIPC